MICEVRADGSTVLFTMRADNSAESLRVRFRLSYREANVFATTVLDEMVDNPPIPPEQPTT